MTVLIPTMLSDNLPYKFVLNPIICPNLAATCNISEGTTLSGVSELTEDNTDVTTITA